LLTDPAYGSRVAALEPVPFYRSFTVEFAADETQQRAATSMIEADAAGAVCYAEAFNRLT